MRFRSFSNKLSIITPSISILLFLLLGISSNVMAGSFFTDITDRIKLRDVDPDIVLRQRAVIVDFGWMSPAAPPETLVFDFFDDIALQANVDDAESGLDDSLVWRGRFDDDHSGIVTLVRQGDSISAIAIVGARRYDVRPLVNGIHVIQEIELHHLRAVAEDETLAQAVMPNGAERLKETYVNAEAGMNDPAWEVFTLTNQERAKYSLSPFQADGRLVTVAQTHSQAQAVANHMHHTSNTAGLYADQGYMASGWAENVAYGSAGSSYATPEGVLMGWMNSPGHRQNILSGNCDLGVGNAVSGSGSVYWTQNFGTEQGDANCSQSNPGDDNNPGDSDDASSSEADSNGSGCFVMTLSRPVPLK